MTHCNANRQPIATIEYGRSTESLAAITLGQRVVPIRAGAAQCPRNRNRCRVVADLVITRLIFKRPAERDRILATERSLSLRRTFQDDFLNEGKRLLVNRHTLVERLKKIDLRRWILHRHYSY